MLPDQNILLPRWAALGTLLLLCGPWLLPSNKLYHQLLLVLLWLPAFVALLRKEFRSLLIQPEVLLFILLALWTLVVLVVKGDGDPWSQAKLPLYVLLSLTGLVLASRSSTPFEDVLRVAAVLGGVLALVSVVYFQLIEPPPKGQRQLAIGLWDTTIMAAHAVGALAILAAGLYRPVTGLAQRLLWATVILGYFLFLGFSQTRGVWLALVGALLVVLLIRPTRKILWSVIVFAGGLLLLGVVFPEFFTQRGLSYRPEILRAGLQLFAENWPMGWGFKSFEIAIPSHERIFEHPHNLFLDLAIRLGLPGLLLFLGLWGAVLWRAWQNRETPLGWSLLILWVFSTLALMTDGIGLWFKPNADWLITWLPIGLSMVLGARQVDARIHKQSVYS